MQIKGLNARQIPKIKDICANKEYHDVLYGYLQEHSDWDGIQGHPRYVNKKIVNFKKIGEALGMSRQTVSTKFKALQSDEGLNLISKEVDDRGNYTLTLLPSDVASLIPYSTLKLLVDALNEKSISTFVYLLTRYLANQEKSFLFSLQDIKKHIGISVNTRSNDETVINILFVLQKMGLIEYELTTQQGDKGVKTIYRLKKLTNFLER